VYGLYVLLQYHEKKAYFPSGPLPPNYYYYYFSVPHTILLVAIMLGG